MQHRKIAAGFALAAAALFTSLASQADEWKQEFAPYLWGAAMSGEAGIGSVTSSIDMSFGDILDNLELGFMGAYRASKY